jgi:hypothetical protein
MRERPGVLGRADRSCSFSRHDVWLRVGAALIMTAADAHDVV